MIKGTDRTFAFALYKVAKEQNRKPCLALAKYYENVTMYDEDCGKYILKLIFISGSMNRT